MANFEVFRKSTRSSADQPTVTVQKRGTISFNRASHLALGAPDAVELLYDAEARIIGLRAVGPHSEHASFVRSSTGRESGPYVVTAIAFLRFYKITAAITRRWPATMQDDVLCIDLNEPGTPVTSNRAKRDGSTSMDA